MFQGMLQCRRCTGKRADGTRCSRNTCKYLPMCFQHLRKEMGLVVKQSTIPNAGLGLFAARPFANGELIGPVDGQRLTKQQLDERYKDFEDLISAPYGVRIGADEIADGALQRWVGHFSNTRIGAHMQSIKQGTNAKIVTTGGVPWLRATRNIASGSEILTWYGYSYTVDPQAKSRTR